MKVLSKSAILRKFGYQNAKESLTDFKQGCRLIGLTRGQFSLIDLILAIIDKIGPAEVNLVTWSAGIKDLHQMDAIKKSGKIVNCLIITDHSYVTRQKNYAISLDQLFGSENIRTSEIHAKFVIIHNKQYKVTIRTSMNLNANRTCENYEIDEDETIFTFYKDFFDSIFKAMPEGLIKSSSIVNSKLNTIFGTSFEEKKSTSLCW